MANPIDLGLFLDVVDMHWPTPQHQLPDYFVHVYIRCFLEPQLYQNPSKQAVQPNSNDYYLTHGHMDLVEFSPTISASHLLFNPPPYVTVDDSEDQINWVIYWTAQTAQISMFTGSIAQGLPSPEPDAATNAVVIPTYDSIAPTGQFAFALGGYPLPDEGAPTLALMYSGTNIIHDASNIFDIFNEAEGSLPYGSLWPNAQVALANAAYANYQSDIALSATGDAAPVLHLESSIGSGGWKEDAGLDGHGNHLVTGKAYTQYLGTIKLTSYQTSICYFEKVALFKLLRSSLSSSPTTIGTIQINAGYKFTCDVRSYKTTGGGGGPLAFDPKNSKVDANGFAPNLDPVGDVTTNVYMPLKLAKPSGLDPEADVRFSLSSSGGGEIDAGGLGGLTAGPYSRGGTITLQANRDGGGNLVMTVAYDGL